eukprot:TRINITY_DN31398_c0_g1_i1.p1 TRINITY_DN31398_c0_g1~~TRINITY_DN31398_c0_g1_i1.p1  ORF type:complete len:564 (+),score=130.07 TRINITY_DN31398_c0_g1_i1:173-1864(+)
MLSPSKLFFGTPDPDTSPGDDVKLEYIGRDFGLWQDSEGDEQTDVPLEQSIEASTHESEEERRSPGLGGAVGSERERGVSMGSFVVAPGRHGTGAGAIAAPSAIGGARAKPLAAVLGLDLGDDSSVPAAVAAAAMDEDGQDSDEEEDADDERSHPSVVELELSKSGKAPPASYAAAVAPPSIAGSGGCAVAPLLGIDGPSFDAATAQGLALNGELDLTSEPWLSALPSIGSAMHFAGTCDRCCFHPKGRCLNGFNCQHCHFDHEKRKRKNKKKSKAENSPPDASMPVSPDGLMVDGPGGMLAGIAGEASDGAVVSAVGVATGASVMPSPQGHPFFPGVSHTPRLAHPPATPFVPPGLTQPSEWAVPAEAPTIPGAAFVAGGAPPPGFDPFPAEALVGGVAAFPPRLEDLEASCPGDAKDEYIRQLEAENRYLRSCLLQYTGGAGLTCPADAATLAVATASLYGSDCLASTPQTAPQPLPSAAAPLKPMPAAATQLAPQAGGLQGLSAGAAPFWPSAGQVWQPTAELASGKSEALVSTETRTSATAAVDGGSTADGTTGAAGQL